MEPDSRKVQLVQHLPHSVTHTLSLDIPITGSPIEYHLCLATSANCQIEGIRIYLSSESDSNSSAAILYCHANRIEIQGVQSNVHVKGTSWTGNTAFSHGSEINRFQLRPDDLFYIDNTEVMIRVGGMDQSEPSANAESPPMPDPILPTQPIPASSPHSRLEPGTAIMETPSKNPETARIMKTLASYAIEGKDNSQDWPLNIVKRATLSSVREARQVNQSSPVPAVEQQPKLPGSDVTPSKIGCPDSIDPRNPDYQQSPERELDYSQSSVASAQSHTHTRIKDESQASNTRHADALLAIAQTNEQSSSLLEKNEPTPTAEAVKEDTKDHTMLDLQSMTSRVPDLGVTRVPRYSNNADNHDVEFKDHQASSQNPPTEMETAQWGSGMNDTLERSPKRVKLSQSHGPMPTAVASNNRDADVTTDDDEPENDSAAGARTKVAATVDDDATHELLEKTPLASLNDVPNNSNSPTEETLLQAPHDGSSNSVKPISPTMKKRAAAKRATVPQRTPKQRTPLSRRSLATPEVSTEKSSSSRNSKSTARDSPSKTQEPLPKMRVLFASSTTLDTSKTFMKFLTAHGVERAKSIDDATILCVGKEAELKRTCNLILAVLNGKDVITDNWISESVKAKVLLDLGQYKATDPSREDEWGTSLTEAIARGKEGLRPFADWSFCFTPAVRTELGKGYADIKSVGLQGGAKSIQATLPRKGPQEPCRTIIIASNGDDKDVEFLHRHGWKVYSKDLITLSILRGSLQLESEEFVIQDPSPPQASKSKKRKR
ncbi:MAG: hypothetical protein Q9195_006542 [Heterodermia aff. obscurata]